MMAGFTMKGGLIEFTETFPIPVPSASTAGDSGSKANSGWATDTGPTFPAVQRKLESA